MVPVSLQPQVHPLGDVELLIRIQVLPLGQRAGDSHDWQGSEAHPHGGGAIGVGVGVGHVVPDTH